MNLLSVVVTTAVANQVSSPKQWRRAGMDKPLSMLVQGNLVYGSGGTSADAWVQTSIDGGASWTDVANFHFLVASARFLYNLSGLTPVTTQLTPTDGTLGANTSKDGVLGDLWRVKYTTVGTYSGNTTLLIDVSAGGMSA